MRQQDFFKEDKKFQKPYGGILHRTRKGRSHGRPLATRHTMHLVLRSSKAVGAWSLKRFEGKIEAIIRKFAAQYGIRILSLANVGNHLHMQIKLQNRFTYAAFIRAISGAIAIAVTGRTRWHGDPRRTKLKFWDYRPFTRIVKSFKAFLNLKDYIEINRIEGFGYRRNEARFIFGMATIRSG